jgi:hypothetical protein
VTTDPGGASVRHEEYLLPVDATLPQSARITTDAGRLTPGVEQT